LAEKYFTYLSDCRGKWDIVLGDARLSLENEPDQKFNVLIVDAFSGDAIPTHLLTAEAFEVYRRHLVPGGVIAVHISNTYLRLAPVVRGVAEHCGMKFVRISDSGDKTRLSSISEWMLVTRNDAFLAAHPQKADDEDDDNLVVPLWTDQYSNLFQILSGGIGKFWR
jgi:spermidine synthase